jgi:hypothetical protein
MENASNPTAFSDDSARNARIAEYPVAAANNSFTNGLNLGGANAVGIGINMSATVPFPVVGTPEQFTLLDQDEDIRVGQRSQSIGGLPFVSRVGDQEFTWDRSQPSYTPKGAASSGGTEGDLPAAAIYTGTLPTNDEKEAAQLAGASIDGVISKTGNASLATLAGWAPTA